MSHRPKELIRANIHQEEKLYAPRTTAILITASPPPSEANTGTMQQCNDNESSLLPREDNTGAMGDRALRLKQNGSAADQKAATGDTGGAKATDLSQNGYGGLPRVISLLINHI